MGPFDFLTNIENGLKQYFQPTLDYVGNTISQMFPTQSNAFGTVQGSKGPDLHPLINAAAKAQAAQQPQQPQPSPQQQYRGVMGAQTSNLPTPADFSQGFNAFSQNAPIATASPLFAQAAQRLPSNIDPYLPAVISLMETGGGVKQVANNNPFNIRGIQGGQTQFINYPDLATAILGGNNGGVQAGGFVGQILNNPAFSNFRTSGNLSDFFNAYTPPGPAYGNPTLEQLLSRYAALRALFPNAQ